VETASLVPCLKRLEEKKCIYREEVLKGRIVYYRLTRQGRQRLKADVKRWKRIRNGIEAAIETPLGEAGDRDFYQWVPAVSPRRVAYGDFDQLA
jgi:DNA-binding PadR family transcriptional regulator